MQISVRYRVFNAEDTSARLVHSGPNGSKSNVGSERVCV